MKKCKPLLALAVLLSLLGIGLANATPTAAKPVLPVARVVDCCDDPTCQPGCCPECPLDCVPASQHVKTANFTCPLTGEELPCPNCCPLNQPTTKATKDCPPCPLCP
jgi:hypothetical protein